MVSLLQLNADFPSPENPAQVPQAVRSRELTQIMTQLAPFLKSHCQTKPPSTNEAPAEPPGSPPKETREPASTALEVETENEESSSKNGPNEKIGTNSNRGACDFLSSPRNQITLGVGRVIQKLSLTSLGFLGVGGVQSGPFPCISDIFPCSSPAIALGRICICNTYYIKFWDDVAGRDAGSRLWGSGPSGVVAQVVDLFSGGLALNTLSRLKMRETV